MSKLRQPPVFIIICVALVAVSFFAGQHFITASKNKNLPSIYQGALPSIGPLVNLKEMKVSYDTDFALAPINQEELEAIKIGQKVVLYDEDKNAMPLGGTVAGFTTEDGQIITLIQLPDGTNTELLSSTVAIITRELRAMQRLPLDIIQTNEDGQQFVWIAQLDNDVALYRLIKHPIEIGLQNDIYFEPKDLHKAPEGLIIINPDKKINEDKHYVVTRTKIDAPLHNPIRQAWGEFELYRLDIQKDALAQRVEDCINGANKAPTAGELSAAAGSSSSSSCGGSSNPDDIMFEIFQGLTQGPDGNGNACGSNACGQ